MPVCSSGVSAFGSVSTGFVGSSGAVAGSDGEREDIEEGKRGKGKEKRKAPGAERKSSLPL
jgi:hypothetical protein